MAMTITLPRHQNNKYIRLTEYCLFRMYLYIPIYDVLAQILSRSSRGIVWMMITTMRKKRDSDFVITHFRSLIKTHTHYLDHLATHTKSKNDARTIWGSNDDDDDDGRPPYYECWWMLLLLPTVWKREVKSRFFVVGGFGLKSPLPTLFFIVRTVSLGIGDWYRN